MTDCCLHKLFIIRTITYNSTYSYFYGISMKALNCFCDKYKKKSIVIRDSAR